MDLEIHKGVIERWVRRPDAKGFGVLKLDRKPYDFIGSKFGPNLQEGDHVAFLARLDDHPKYGPRYAVEKTVMHLPAQWNVAGWLIQRLPHIGPVRAQAVEEAFGERIWDVLETNPLELTQISGITEDRARHIAEAYSRERETVETYMHLLKLGVDPKVTVALIRKDLPASQLRHYLDTDPYQLIHFDGVLFKHCDEIGLRVGVPKMDRRRVRGFIVSLLREARADGHTCLHMNRVKQDVRETLGVGLEQLAAALTPTPAELRLLEKGFANIEAVDEEGAVVFPPPFVFFGRYVQWRELAEHDAQIVTLLNRSARTEEPEDHDD